MSYTDDAVLAKLSALVDTQDSIVTVAQWIMFHRRHAERTVQLWLQRLKESTSNKRLSLIYVANEVAQQSRARHKEDFLVAFSPAIAEAIATAYKGAPSDVQQRIRRVVDVWRERRVFEEPIQAAIEARITELEKAKGTTKVSFGGSIFGTSSIPAELAPLVTPQQNVTKLLLNTKTSVNTANQDYEKLMGPASEVPSAPVYAARLSGLLKTLAQAEGAVEQCVNARRDLVNELQKILDVSRSALIADEDQLETFVQRKFQVEDKKTEVERAIMAGLPNDEPYIPNADHDENLAPEPDRPEVEELTPPPTEQSDIMKQPTSDQNPRSDWSPNPPQDATFHKSPTPALDILSSLTTQYKSVPTTANGSKKRRLDDDSEIPNLGGEDGIDADVAEMLRKDSISQS